MKCSYCDRDLIEEEAETPRKDRSGEVMCDECYRERFEFTCCWCEEYGDEADRHNMLVVGEETDGVEPGIHRVIKRPYYADGMIEGHLYSWALERIAALLEGIDLEGFPCGHLCIDCQNKIDTVERSETT